MTNFFTNLKTVEHNVDIIIENISLNAISEDDGKFQIKKLYKDFILSFHYPHEKDSPYIKNELKESVNVNRLGTQPFNQDK